MPLAKLSIQTRSFIRSVVTTQEKHEKSWRSENTGIRKGFSMFSPDNPDFFESEFLRNRQEIP